MPILSANRIGGVRKDKITNSGASTFGVGAFPISNIAWIVKDFNYVFAFSNNKVLN